MNKRISDLRLADPVIATNILAALANEADALDIDCRRWFSGLGLSREQINDASVRVSYRQARLVLKRALRTLPGSNLGLSVGRRQTIGNFGVLGLAMMTAPSFGEALALSIEHHTITGSLVDLDIEPVDDEHIAIVLRQRHPDPDLLPFLCEELFSSSLMVCRTLVGEAFRPKRLELSYPAPDYAEEYVALFQSVVRFGARQNRAIIESRWLAQRMPSYNPISHQQAMAVCRAQSAAVAPSTEITDSVERLLRRDIGRNPTLGQVAETLHLTERTLRRQLTAAGQGFRELQDRVRSDHACELLRRPELTVADVGTAVGFRDVREFRRAFKRWTGVAPRTMREEGPKSGTALTARLVRSA